jgi:predicted nucleic acid-binding protein
MIVVSDSSPLNILIRIGCVEVLPKLFGAVVIPPAVAAELSHPATPESIRKWLATPPVWLRVQAPE